MRFLKNRTVLGVLCIVLSLIICFAVTPLFNKAMSEKTEIIRVVKNQFQWEKKLLLTW